MVQFAAWKRTMPDLWIHPEGHHLRAGDGGSVVASTLWGKESNDLHTHFGDNDSVRFSFGCASGRVAKKLMDKRAVVKELGAPAFQLKQT